MIESPRWLATRGNLKDCAANLMKIAHINGKKDVDITEAYLRKILPTIKVEPNYGMASFFTSWRLAINTSLLVSCW